jgi:serine phosphatase RsbU (regulator of sigma subunit)/PAS domain-containing protein
VPFEGLLTEAGRLLAASLDLDDTLRTVARLAIPEFADWAAVDFIEPDGGVRQVSSGYADPGTDAFLLELRRRHRVLAKEAGWPPTGAMRVLATGEPAVFQPVPAAQLPIHSEDEEEIWERVGALSWLVVPLTVGARTIGALTFLSNQPGRIYDEADFPVASELADRCAQALRNAQLYDEAQSARALLDTVFAAAPVGMALLDAELREVLVNDRMADFAITPDPDLARRVFAFGETIGDVEIRAGRRAFVASYAPVDIGGRVLGVIVAVVETTERQRLLERTSRLQAVTEQLSAALTKDQVAAVILAEGTAATGACCAVLGFAADDRELVIEHRLGLAADAPSRLPLDAGAPLPIAVRSGAPVLIHSHEEWVQRFPGIPPRGRFEAFAAVPLLFEDHVAGVMGLGFAEVRSFPAEDVELLMAIARQGAQALDRARLYEERAYVARTLQEGLLPRALPGIDGFELAVRYRPIGDGSELGGDFYDVVPLNDGSWLVAVGDICGKGTGAAVLTGVMRSTIRALALHESRAEELLRGVNEALIREGSSNALASMACATIHDGAGGVEVRVAAGGHPPPLVLRREGGVEALDARGPMLGIQSSPDLVVSSEHLAPGDLLLLYTDGVIDARSQGAEPFGEDRLQAALAAGAGRDVHGALEIIDAAVRAYAPGPPRDDKALLAVRSSG